MSSTFYLNFQKDDRYEPRVEYYFDGMPYPAVRTTQKGSWAISAYLAGRKDNLKPALRNYIDWKQFLKWKWIAERLPKTLGEIRIGMIFNINYHNLNMDLDNLIKAVKDALNGQAWEDDKLKFIRRYSIMDVVLKCETCKKRPKYKVGEKKGQYKTNCSNYKKCTSTGVRIYIEKRLNNG